MARLGVARHGKAGKEKTMVYQFKKGARINADAQLIGQELEAIGPNAVAAQVVDAGRDESTELHKVFEWDDEVAAEEYRLEQARYVLRHIVIVQESATEPGELVAVKAYHHVDIGTAEDPKMAYVPVATIARDPDLRSQVIAKLRFTIEQAERTIESFQEICIDMADVRQHLTAAREAIPAR